MPNDISVQAITTMRTGGDATVEPKAVAIEPAPQEEPAPAPSPIVNPTLRLDAALGLVVIEFRNDAGSVTTSIPSQRQLEAYQRWENTRFGPAPAGRAHAVPGDPQPVAGRTAAAPTNHPGTKSGRTNPGRTA